MVEYATMLDAVFGSLADATRRDILKRVAKKELTVSEVAKPYHLTLAAVSKHLHVLEKAKLIVKRREGKRQVVSLSPKGLAHADRYLKQYAQMWEDRLDSLEKYLRTNS
jgi:DNA-binding transcriptional ArsR family regulator